MSLMVRKQKSVIPYLAMIVLIIGIVSTIYVFANQNDRYYDPETLRINGESFDIDAIFNTYPNTTILTNDGEKTGVKLSGLLISTDISCPTCHTYTIKATDGYQQTVQWNDLENGVLTIQKRVYFRDLSYSFWVREVISIEVD